MPETDLSKLKIDKTGGFARKGTRIKSVTVIVIAIIVIVILGVFIGGRLMPAVTVETAAVSQIYPYQTFTILNASGYVVAGRKAAVASKTTGRLISLFVEEGSKVKSGQIIARLESDDAAAAYKQAEARVEVTRQNLEQAKAELNDAQLALQRNKELIAKGYVSQADFDASDARYKKAKALVSAAEAEIKASEAGLQAAKVALEYTNIRAPFDAVVLTKNADVGDIITPLGAAANAKAAVVTIADMSSLEVEADVSESNLGKVKAGQPCEIQLDSIPDERFRGKLHMIVPTADRTKASVMTKVRFLDTDKRILPEMSAKVAFLERPVGQNERLPKTIVSPAAVWTVNGKNMVYTAAENIAKEVPVKLGPKMGDFIEVIEGLRAGDKVILNPPKHLKNGANIKVKEK